MTDYDEKPQALRYRPTPGGLLLNLTVRKLAHVRSVNHFMQRLIQIGVGLGAVFVPAFLMAQAPEQNPAVQGAGTQNQNPI